MGFPKHQNFLLLTNTSHITNIPGLGAKNLPKINDTPRAAADARATLLLLLLPLLLLHVTFAEERFSMYFLHGVETCR